jgi:lysophospholipase L1-like esterase
MEKYKNATVLVLGDSIMFGSGNNGFGVGEYLAKDLGMKCVKYAIGGARVGYREGKYWMVEQVRQIINDGVQADYIVFDGFTNDCNQDKPEDLPDIPLGEMVKGYAPQDIFAIDKAKTTFTSCFESILCALMNYFPHAKLLFIRPHNMGRRDDVLQKLYGERALTLCKKWGVAYVDLYSESGLNTFLPVHRDLFTNDSYGWGRGDCTHPNATGYEEKYMPLIEAKIKTL